MFNKKKYLGLNKFTYLNINGKYNLDGGSSELLEKEPESEPEICTCTKTDSTANNASGGGGGAAVDINTSIKCICNETYIKNIYDEIINIFEYYTSIKSASIQLKAIKSNIRLNKTFNLSKIQEILENIQSYFLISTKKENIQGRSGFNFNDDIYQAVIMFCFNLKIYEEILESSKEELSESSQEELPESSKEEILESSKEELSDWVSLESSKDKLSDWVSLESSEQKNQKIITHNSRKFIFYINNDIILQIFLNAYSYLQKEKKKINDIKTKPLQFSEELERVLSFLEGSYIWSTIDVFSKTEVKEAKDAEAKAAHKRKYLKYKNKYLQLKRSNKL
jgi:hypothetical protein